MNLISNIFFVWVLAYHLCQATIEKNEKLVINHHTDFCPRYRKLLNGEIVLDNALKGMYITAALSLRNDEKDPIWKLIMDEISRRGQFNVIYTPTGGVEGNQTWTDKLFSELAIYDVYVDSWTRFFDRMNKGVLFPESWWAGDRIMVIKPKQKKFDFWAFSRPFSQSVWATAIAITLFTGCVYYFLDYLRSFRHGDRELEHDLKKVFFLSMNDLVGHCEFEPRSSSGRLLTVSMNLFVVILISAYTANLANVLVLKNSSQSEINSIKDVIKIEGNICIKESDTYIDTLTKKYPEAKSLIIPFENEKEMYAGLHDEKCLILLTSLEAWKNRRRDENYNKECGMKLVGRRVEVIPASFTLLGSIDLCRALLYDVLNFHLLQMKSEGILEEIWANYRDRTIVSTCSKSGDKPIKNTQLNTKDLAGLFLLYFFNVILIVTIEILLMCHAPKEQKKLLKNDLSQNIRNTCKLCQAKNNSDVDNQNSFMTKSNWEIKKGARMSRRQFVQHINYLEEKFETEFNDLQKKILEYGPRRFDNNMHHSTNNYGQEIDNTDRSQNTIPCNSTRIKCQGSF